MWRIDFTMEMVGMELFVSDPNALISTFVTEEDLLSRLEAFNMMETTTVVNVTQV